VILIYISVFIFGTIFGSFFLLIADRSTQVRYKNRPFAILLDNSHCEYCGIKLKPYNLIPIISFLGFRGRCMNCYTSLSLRYPLAEIISGTLLLLLFHNYGITVESVTLYFLIITSIFITYADIKKMIIPDLLIIFFIINALISVLYSGIGMTNLYGALFLGGIFLIILLIFPGGFGGGDMKYGAAIGFFCGFSLSVIVLEAALISGSLFGVVFAFITGKGLRIRLPFAPFLTFGFIIALFFGIDLINMYRTFFF
jgi:leader peptidase (prepilin peptidase)/N-methyltransferase